MKTDIDGDPLSVHNIVVLCYNVIVLCNSSFVRLNIVITFNFLTAGQISSSTSLPMVAFTFKHDENNISISNSS